MKDPYVYENTDVLINLANITSNEKLEKFENDISTISIYKLINDKTKINGLSDVFIIHKSIFQSVYSWAGQPRTINLYKEEMVLDGLSVQYSDYSLITKSVEKLDNQFKQIQWESLTKRQIIQNFAHYFSKLWQIHPFREGNTRAVSTLMALFARQINLKLDVEFISENAKYFRNALVINSIGQYSEPEYLENFLSDTLLLKMRNGKEEKYQTIKGYELSKYQYKNHNYKD